MVCFGMIADFYHSATPSHVFLQFSSRIIVFTVCNAATTLVSINLVGSYQNYFVAWISTTVVYDQFWKKYFAYSWWEKDIELRFRQVYGRVTLILFRNISKHISTLLYQHLRSVPNTFRIKAITAKRHISRGAPCACRHYEN